MSNTVELILRVRAGQIYPPKHAKKIIYHQSNCVVIKRNSVQTKKTSDYKKTFDVASFQVLIEVPVFKDHLY